MDTLLQVNQNQAAGNTASLFIIMIYDKKEMPKDLVMKTINFR
jgi:hypothetical protein